MPNRIRRALLETPAGAVHVRTAGAGAPVLLLHWTPGSSHQYKAILPELAARGYRAIAPDHMGFGFSDPRTKAWSVADFADNVADVMTCLGVAKAHVVGGHFSSEIATELTLRHPARVSMLVLDGSPVWSREMREKVLASARPQPPPWSEAGDHIAWIWQRAIWLRKMWEPNFRLNAEGADVIKHAVLENLLAGDTSDTAEALKDYDMEAALQRLSVPTLAITATGDPLTSCHGDVLRLAPGSRGHTYIGAHPMHRGDRAPDYVRVLHAFFTNTAPELFDDVKTYKPPAGASYA